MKIAVTYNYVDGQVFQHFGQSQYFKIYQVENKQVVAAETVSTEGCGHCALAGALAAEGVDTLICGGIGGGAVNLMQEYKIAVFPGVSGQADKAVENFLRDNLIYQEGYVCRAHEEQHGAEHQCHAGSHNCRANQDGSEGGLKRMGGSHLH